LIGESGFADAWAVTLLRLEDYATDHIGLVGEPKISDELADCPSAIIPDRAKESIGVRVGRIRLVGWRFGAIAAEAPIVSSAVRPPLIEPTSILADPAPEARRVESSCGNP